MALQFLLYVFQEVAAVLTNRKSDKGPSNTSLQKN